MNLYDCRDPRRSRRKFQNEHAGVPENRKEARRLPKHARLALQVLSQMSSFNFQLSRPGWENWLIADMDDNFQQASFDWSRPYSDRRYHNVRYFSLCYQSSDQLYKKLL